jgi:methyl-accepting chemotaxis protein
LPSFTEGLGVLNGLILDQNKAITASSAPVEEMSGAISAVTVAMREMKAAETVLDLAKDTRRNIQVMEETIGSFKV